ASQISALGPVPPVQLSVPLTQRVVPSVHSPSLVPQLAPPPGSPSSIGPSQSLSRASQTSGTGPRSPTQVNAPATQRRWPSRHSPTSLPQGPALGTPSSIAPSQSSSIALQLSPLG